MAQKETDSILSASSKPQKRAASSTRKRAATTPAKPKEPATSKVSAAGTTRHRTPAARPVAPVKKMPTDVEIAELAYIMYEARCQGSPDADWVAAEAYLKSKV